MSPQDQVHRVQLNTEFARAFYPKLCLLSLSTDVGRERIQPTSLRSSLTETSDVWFTGVDNTLVEMWHDYARKHRMQSWTSGCIAVKHASQHLQNTENTGTVKLTLIFPVNISVIGLIVASSKDKKTKAWIEDVSK